MKKNEIEQLKEEIITADGPWIANVHLGEGVWAKNGPEAVASQRMVKILQAASDFGLINFKELKVLDLGTQEGVHALEFAHRGAIVTAVEARANNFRKLQLAKKGNKLENLTLLQADIRNLNLSDLGEFDIIICSGILYHLPKRTQPTLLQDMAQCCKSLLIIDTHVGFTRHGSFEYNDHLYFGSEGGEFSVGQTDQDFERHTGRSIDNEPSFQISRESLVNFLVDCGFSSVYESFVPVRSPQNERALVNRCNFVAYKGRPAKHNEVSFPNERYTEGDLSFYSPRDLQLMERLKKSTIYTLVRAYLRFF